jgi:hypothetical protein
MGRITRSVPSAGFKWKRVEEVITVDTRHFSAGRLAHRMTVTRV